MVTATVTNNYVEPFPRGRLTFVIPAGHYHKSHGTIETAMLSDDGKYTVVSIRVDTPKRQQIRVRVAPQRNGANGMIVQRRRGYVTVSLEVRHGRE